MEQFVHHHPRNCYFYVIDIKKKSILIDKLYIKQLSNLKKKTIFVTQSHEH